MGIGFVTVQGPSISDRTFAPARSGNVSRRYRRRCQATFLDPLFEFVKQSLNQPNVLLNPPAELHQQDDSKSETPKSTFSVRRKEETTIRVEEPGEELAAQKRHPILDRQNIVVAVSSSVGVWYARGFLTSKFKDVTRKGLKLSSSDENLDGFDFDIMKVQFAFADEAGDEARRRLESLATRKDTTKRSGLTWTVQRVSTALALRLRFANRGFCNIEHVKDADTAQAKFESAQREMSRLWTEDRQSDPNSPSTYVVISFVAAVKSDLFRHKELTSALQVLQTLQNVQESQLCGVDAMTFPDIADPPLGFKELEEKFPQLDPSAVTEKEIKMGPPYWKAG